MTTDQIAALSAELETDPEGIGYAAQPMTPEGHLAVHALLTDRIHERADRASLEALWAHLSQTGIYVRFLLNQGHADVQVRGACLMALEIMRYARFSGLDVFHAMFDAQMTILLNAEIVEQEDIDGIKALGMVPASRAEIACGAGVVPTAADVSNIREALNA